MKYLVRLANAKGVVSILMIVTFFLPWYEWWTQSNNLPYQSIFQTTKDFGMTWIIIFLSIINLIICVLEIDDRNKNMILGVLIAIILIVNLISKFYLVPDTFLNTRFGWKLMTILCFAQVMMALNNLKNDR
jgi:magnesium-transporting ATPase (P-type)